MSNFSVGEKVVCVNVKPRNRQSSREAVRHLRLNAVYVVRDAFPAPGNSEPSVRLVGIILPIHPHYGIESAFASNRFRRLSEVKSDPLARSAIDG